MTPQEHWERLRKALAERRLGELSLGDIGHGARGLLDRALDRLGSVEIGALVTDLRVATAFYTRLPLPSTIAVDGSALARASWCSPLVGALIGAVGGLAYWVSERLNLPQFVSATLAVTAAAAFTGFLHEDGLADMADGIGGGDTRERILDIMRDGRIGAFGTCALIICFGLRIGSLADLPNAALVAWALVGAHATARAVLPLIMRLVPPARPDGLAAAAGAPSRERVVISVAIGIVLLVLALGFKNALIALVLVLVGAAVTAWIARRRIGGQTGDVLGAVEQVGECIVLLVTAARF